MSQRSKMFVLLASCLMSMINFAMLEKPATAQQKVDYKFLCKSINGTPAVVAVSDVKGVPVPLIAPKRHSSVWTSENRCEVIARRFQDAYDNGQLELMRIGPMNGETTICVAKNAGSCGKLILTFKPEDRSRAGEIFQLIFENSQAESPVAVPVNSLRVQVNGVTYFNIGRYLNHQAASGTRRFR